MFGFIKEPDLEITCFTTAGVWYDRVYRKGRETNWMKKCKKEKKSGRK